MFSIDTVQRCINCLLLVLIFLIEISAMAAPLPSEFDLNAEEVELVEMSDTAEDKKETAEHDLDKDSTPLILLLHHFGPVSSNNTSQMSTEVTIPEMDIIVPPPKF